MNELVEVRSSSTNIAYEMRNGTRVELQRVTAKQE